MKKVKYKWIKPGTKMPAVTICEGVGKYRYPTFDELMEKAAEGNKTVYYLKATKEQFKLQTELQLKEIQNLKAALEAKSKDAATRQQLAYAISKALEAVATICGETGLIR